MHGRGYVKEGHKVAATYIATEFEHFGLRPFQLDYFQSFPLTVNTFPGKVDLRIDGKKLIPGVDFLVDPSSPGLKGRHNVLLLNIDSLLRKSFHWVKELKQTEHVVAVDMTGYDQLADEDKNSLDHLIDVLKYSIELKVPAYIQLSDDKLTWGISRRQSPRPTFYVMKQSVGDNMESVRFNISNHLFKERSQNVIGLIEGKRTDSTIMITAHYDHLGRLGKKTYFPGANDNASGVAMLLNLARHYSLSEKPKYNMLFVAFGGEEAGLVGSEYYIKRPLHPLNKVKLLINLDMVGTGDDGITVVNGKVYLKLFDQLTSLNDDLLPEINARGSACNSDHCFFDREGIRTFFIYTLGGIQAYHDINDRSNTLPLTEYEDLFVLLTRFLASL